MPVRFQLFFLTGEENPIHLGTHRDPLTEHRLKLGLTFSSFFFLCVWSDLMECRIFVP